MDPLNVALLAVGILAAGALFLLYWLRYDAVVAEIERDSKWQSTMHERVWKNEDEDHEH